VGLHSLCLAEAVVFTERCEKALLAPPNGLNKLKTHYQNQLTAYTSAAQQHNMESNANRIVFLKLQALIMDVIHFIDIIEQLLAADCRTVAAWIWQKQLRYGTYRVQ